MAGASSPTPAMAADEVEMAGTSGPSTAVERFGSEIASFGLLICNAVERHMLRCRDPEAVLPISFGMVCSEVAGSGATVLDSGDRIDVLEVTGVGKALKARLENKDGIAGTVGTFSPPNQLEAAWAHSGGQETLDKEIFELIEHVQAHVSGGLVLNRFEIGFGCDGVLGLLCATCANGRPLAFGNSGRAARPTPLACDDARKMKLLLYKAGMCTSDLGHELKSSNLALDYSFEFIVTQDYCFHFWIAIPPSTYARAAHSGGLPNSTHCAGSVYTVCVEGV